jgi:uncharacterized membrane protein
MEENNNDIQEYRNSYNPVNPLAVLAVIVIGPLALIAVIAILIAAWPTLTKMGATLVNGIISFVVIVAVLLLLVIIVGCIVKGIKLYHDVQLSHLAVEQEKEDLEARKAERRRLDERHDTEMHLLKTRAGFDENGNPPIFVSPEGYTLMPFGQFKQPVPSSYHYNIRTETTQGALDGKAPLELGPGQRQEELPLPKIEMFYSLIPFNSLQTGMGIDALTGQPILAPIVKSTHFKLIGGSGQGKSCVAAAIIDIAATTNDPDHLRIGLLDLEHNTSRLFENLPHIAEIGPRRIRLIGRDADEVAQKLKLLQWELKRRSELGEEYCRAHEPILLVYVEEMLALKYEVVDKKLNQEMLAAINILGVRARKYGIFLLACMQTDYSDKSTREAMAQFRTRAGFAIDPDTARASGFFNTELINQNFQTGRRGQYVLEKPAFSGLVLSPDYDVAAKLEALNPTTRTAMPSLPGRRNGSRSGAEPASVVDPVADTVVDSGFSTTRASDANLASLTEQEWRIVQKWRDGMGLKAIIASEFTNSKGEPVTGGDLFTQKSKEIQLLIARFLPDRRQA